jgi:hypothetical protein
MAGNGHPLTRLEEQEARSAEDERGLGAGAAREQAQSILRDAGAIFLRGREGEEVGVEFIRIAEIGGRNFSGESNERIPKSPASEPAALSEENAGPFDGALREMAGQIEEHGVAGGGRKNAGGIGIRKFEKKGIERGPVRSKGGPPVAIIVEDERAGLKNTENAQCIFAGDGEDHVHEFTRVERLANDGTDIHVFRFFLGVADEDGIGESHGIRRD